MKTRAKFKCTFVGQRPGWSEKSPVVFDVELEPSIGDDEDSPENEKLWQGTPSGKIEMSTISDQRFKVGKEYYIDFSLAE